MFAIVSVLVVLASLNAAAEELKDIWQPTSQALLEHFDNVQLHRAKKNLRKQSPFQQSEDSSCALKGKGGEVFSARNIFDKCMHTGTEAGVFQFELMQAFPSEERAQGCATAEKCEGATTLTVYEDAMCFRPNKNTVYVATYYGMASEEVFGQFMVGCSSECSFEHRVFQTEEGGKALGHCVGPEHPTCERIKAFCTPENTVDSSADP